MNEKTTTPTLTNCLNIGQTVYVVCKLFTGGDKFKIYVSGKQINRIERNKDGTDIIYTAGKHNELRFHDISVDEPDLAKKQFQTLGVRLKPVFLDREEAEEARDKFVVMEYNQQNGITSKASEDTDEE